MVVIYNFEISSFDYQNGICAREELSGDESADDGKLDEAIFGDGPQKSCFVKEGENGRIYRAGDVGLVDVTVYCFDAAWEKQNRTAGINLVCGDARR